MRPTNTLRSALATVLTIATIATAHTAIAVGPAEVGPAATENAAGFYHPLTPARILDTREGNGAPARPVGPDSSIALSAAGRAGVPSTASAVVLNVTVTQPTSNGFVTVHPDGVDRPTASNLNFTAGQTVPNLVVAKIGDAGKIRLYNSHGSTHLVADVMGWFDDAVGSAPASDGASEQQGMRPVRLLDTRTASRAVSTGGEIELQVAGRHGIPADATAVALNVTATEPIGPGFLTVYPHGVARPTASNLNFVAGQTVPNLVISKIGKGGKVRLYAHAATHVVVDATAYFVPANGAPDGALTALEPARLLDTRSSKPVGSGRHISLQVTGDRGVPSAGVDSVVLNVTVTEPTVSGYVTVSPTGERRPTASNLNFVAGQTVPNLVIAKVGEEGQIDLFNSSGSTHIVVDVAGWFGSTSPMPTPDPDPDPGPEPDPGPIPDPDPDPDPGPGPGPIPDPDPDPDPDPEPDPAPAPPPPPPTPPAPPTAPGPGGVDAQDLLTPPETTSSTWAELRRIAAQDGTVAVIVAVDAPSKRPHELTADAHDEQKAAIDRVSDRLVRELGGTQSTSLRQLGELPLLALEADLATLDLLEASGHVRSVSLDREFAIDVDGVDDADPMPVTGETPVEVESGDEATTNDAGVAATSWNGHGNQLANWWNWYQVGLQSSSAAGYRGAGQTVAVVDTGVERSHSWLSSSVVAEACFLSVNACPNGSRYQYGRGAARPCTFHAVCGHGTHVAHSAAGTWGVAPDAKIVAIQVFQRGPAGKPTYRESSLILAMWYVYHTRSSHRYASVNLSLGTDWGTTGTCDGHTQDGSGAYLTGWIKVLKSVGIATVIAAGNEGYYNGVGHPACISDAVTVANTTYYAANGYRYDAFYSGGNRSWVVDLLAPGTDICSAVPGNRFDCGYIGTSMAAPHVAGAFAVLKAKRPAATVDQVQAQLVRTGRAVRDDVSGLVRRRIDVYQAARSF